MTKTARRIIHIAGHHSIAIPSSDSLHRAPSCTFRRMDNRIILVRIQAHRTIRFQYTPIPFTNRRPLFYLHINCHAPAIVTVRYIYNRQTPGRHFQIRHRHIYSLFRTYNAGCLRYGEPVRYSAYLITYIFTPLVSELNPFFIKTALGKRYDAAIRWLASVPEGDLQTTLFPFYRGLAYRIKAYARRRKGVRCKYSVPFPAAHIAVIIPEHIAEILHHRMGVLRITVCCPVISPFIRENASVRIIKRVILE